MKFFKKFFERLSAKKTQEQHNHNTRHQAQEEINKINSANKKMSEGAANITKMIKTRGGWDSKISGRERDRNHHKS